jgi:hypothetical protein
MDSARFFFLYPEVRGQLCLGRNRLALTLPQHVTFVVCRQTASYPETDFEEVNGDLREADFWAGEDRLVDVVELDISFL